MSIGLNESMTFEKADSATISQVYMYLGALDCFTNGVPERKRGKVVDDFMQKYPLRVDNKANALKTVESLEKMYVDAVKKTPLKTKIQAAFGMKAPENAFKAACVLGAAAVVGSVMAAQGVDHAAAPALVGALSVGMTALATVVGKTAADGTENKPEKIAKEEWNVQKYGDVKRALFALKKMKKALAPESTYKRDVQALYASGLGNPGGMITALNLKQKGGR